ncbi:MAG: hypothetical protein AAGH88_09070 [Planctomycetota bacterium]
MPDTPPHDYHASQAPDLLGTTERLAAQLRRLCDTAPGTDAEGYDETRFAEEHYYKIYEKRYELESMIDALQRKITQAQAAMSEAGDNNDAVATGLDDLNGGGPRTEYAQAQMEIADSIARHRAAEGDLSMAVTLARAALQDAEAYRFPGDQPRDHWDRTVPEKMAPYTPPDPTEYLDGPVDRADALLAEQRHLEALIEAELDPKPSDRPDDAWIPAYPDEGGTP